MAERDPRWRHVSSPSSSTTPDRPEPGAPAQGGYPGASTSPAQAGQEAASSHAHAVPLGVPMPEGESAPSSDLGVPAPDDRGRAIAPPPRRPRLGRRRPARAADPIPSRGKALLIGLVISALLVALAALSGWLIARSTPEPVTTTTATATHPPFKMELPLQVGEYSRDANDGNEPVKGADGKLTLAATYRKGGQPAFVLIVGRPYSEGKTFMRESNMLGVAPVDDGLCGTSADHDGLDGCSLIRDNSGILVVSTVDISQQDLMALTQQVTRQIAGS